MTGKIVDISVDIKSGKPRITLEMNERQAALDTYDELHDADKLTVDIKKYHPGRSKNANSYCWELIGKLSEKLNIPPDEVYREAIRNVGGTFDMVTVRCEAFESLKAAWESKGIGWQAEKMRSSLEGYYDVRLWYGSSVYDTAQMTRLIDVIVTECKAQGIPTETPEELSRLAEAWR